MNTLRTVDVILIVGDWCTRHQTRISSSQMSSLGFIYHYFKRIVFFIYITI